MKKVFHLKSLLRYSDCFFFGGGGLYSPFIAIVYSIVNCIFR